MRLIWILQLLWLYPSTRARPSDNDRECRVGDEFYPVRIFECYVGWQCYEDTYKNGRRLLVHVCEETHNGVNYSVPCFKSGSRSLSFNLKIDESVREIRKWHEPNNLNDEMIRCYLNAVTACELTTDGWLSHTSGCRIYLPNSTQTECCLEGQNKFHIAMLSISLIIGIPAAFILFFCSWVTGIAALTHCTSVVVALVFRTFFTLLIETEIVSEVIKSPGRPLQNWSGCEALVTFETFLLNIVVSFWLILAFYLLECSKTGFEKEPDIRRGTYIVFSLAIVLPIIWLIIMAAGDYGHCWLEKTPVQWVNDSLRVCYIILQIIVISIVVYRTVTEFRTPKNNQALLLGKISIFTTILSPLFLLQFSLTASHPVNAEGEDAHVYTEYFFDGLQCGIVSLVYLFLPEVYDFILDTLGLERKQCHRVFDTLPIPELELKLPDQPNRPTKLHIINDNNDNRKDITYSSVLTPERFERTIELYNRLNAIPKQSDVSQNQPDNSSVKSEYYDVENETISIGDVVHERVDVPDPRRNKYYNSKYLVYDVDSSDSDEIIVAKTEETVHERVDLKVAVDENENGVKLYRSLSGNVLTAMETNGSVLSNCHPMVDRGRKNSAPSLTEVEIHVKEEALPSIYDDLKNFTNKPRPKLDYKDKKRIHSQNWSSYRNRLLDNRRGTKSLEQLDVQKKDVVSNQLDALLSPRYDGEDRKSGMFTNFSFNTENLDKLDVEEDGDKVKKDVVDWEPQKTFFIGEK